MAQSVDLYGEERARIYITLFSNQYGDTKIFVVVNYVKTMYTCILKSIVKAQSKENLNKLCLKTWFWYLSPNLRQMWRSISDKDSMTLEPIVEAWEGDIQAAFNTQDPLDGNTALHKAAIAAKPEMVT